MQLKEPRHKILIVIVALVVSLCMAEFTARIYTDFILHYPSINIYDELLGWKLKKSLHAYRKTSQFSYHIDTNSHGLRSDEIGSEKTADTYRVLILGDSFTFGEGVEVNERFDQQLKKLSIPGKALEVINAGVMGYGTDQELLYLIHEGLKFKPNLVILMTYENDLEDIMLDYNNTRYKPKYTLNDKDLLLTGIPIPLSSQIRDYFYVYAFFYIKFSVKNYQPPAFDVNEATELFIRLENEIHDLCRKNGIKFLNVIFSSLESLEDLNVDWKNAILESNRRQRIPTVDLDPVFLNQEHLQSLFLQGNIHWNPKGSLIAGRFLSDNVNQMIRE